MQRSNEDVMRTYGVVREVKVSRIPLSPGGDNLGNSGECEEERSEDNSDCMGHKGYTQPEQKLVVPRRPTTDGLRTYGVLGMGTIRV